MSLERFHQAQAAIHGGYATALRELQAGRKSSHWIWYIFPQIDGLGNSPMAQQYALQGRDETVAFLRDPGLRSRYAEVLQVVASHCQRGASLEHLMGGRTDALKLASSATLFRTVTLALGKTETAPEFTTIAELCNRVLEALDAQGFPACAYTLGRLA